MSKYLKQPSQAIADVNTKPNGRVPPKGFVANLNDWRSEKARDVERERSDGRAAPSEVTKRTEKWIAQPDTCG